MKKLGFAFASIAASLISVPSFAATATATFPVNINLTSACQVTTAPGAVTFTYASMQATPAAAVGTSVGITCTNTLPYQVSLATVPGNGYNVTDQKTNLAYTLTLNGAAADLTGQVGTGAAQTVNIAGTMAAGQAGTCALASCTNTGSTNLTQTLTITY